MPYDRLYNLLRAEGNSLLQYACDSYPWSVAGATATRDAVFHFAQSEAVATARISRCLAKMHLPLPYRGAFPLSYTTSNFVAVSYLIPRLIDEQRARIAAIESVHDSLPQGEIHTLVAALLKLKVRHLEQLSEFAAAAKAPAAAS